MKNLFNTEDKQEIICRLQKLTPIHQRQWGKMEVAQMLKHCTLPLEMALTNPKPPRSFMGRIMGPLFKNAVMGTPPFKKNSFTPPEFRVVSEQDFNTQKEKLVGLISRFNHENVSDTMHPFFGKLTNEEWGHGNYKHLNHHLSQFGA